MPGYIAAAAGKEKNQRFLKNPWLKGDYREG